MHIFLYLPCFVKISFTFFFLNFRVIQLIGWVHIDVTIDSLIQHEIHIVLFMDSGLVKWLGFLIRITWREKFVQTILIIIKRWRETLPCFTWNMDIQTMWQIWRNKGSIDFYIKHIGFIHLPFHSCSMPLEDYLSSFGEWYNYSHSFLAFTPTICKLWLNLFMSPLKISLHSSFINSICLDFWHFNLTLVN